MYILSLILLILLCIGWFVITTNADIIRYLDPASLIMLLLVTLPVLLSAGLLRDFNSAFRLSIRRTVVCSKAELLRAIEAVTLAAKALWTAGILDTLLGLIFAFTAEQSTRASIYALTRRETEITQLIIQGKSNAMIAGELFISETTVKKHVSNIFDKTGVSRREELIVRVRED